MPLTGKRVLVTGACGTIGKELVRQLLEENELQEVNNKLGALKKALKEAEKI